MWICPRYLNKKALPGAANTGEGKEGSRLCNVLTALLSYQKQEEKATIIQKQGRGYKITVSQGYIYDGNAYGNT